MVEKKFITINDARRERQKSYAKSKEKVWNDYKKNHLKDATDKKYKKLFQSAEKRRDKFLEQYKESMEKETTR